MAEYEKAIKQVEDVTGQKTKTEHESPIEVWVCPCHGMGKGSLLKFNERCPKCGRTREEAMEFTSRWA